MHRTYQLAVTVGNPDIDASELDLVIRQAAAWLSEEIDPEGHHPLRIVVTDALGDPVTGHDYDPDEEV